VRGWPKESFEDGDVFPSSYAWYVDAWGGEPIERRVFVLAVHEDLVDVDDDSFVVEIYLVRFADGDEQEIECNEYEWFEKVKE
jgi:hypothetical protein